MTVASAKVIGVQLGLSADADRFLVELVKVEEVREVTVGMRVALRVQSDASPPVLHCRVVHLELEIG